MFGLGKNRTKFGRYLDSNGIAQIELERTSKLSTGTVSKLCNDKKYRPKFSTITQIVKGLKKLGKNIDEHDFWM
ncbi:helix-turn-helix domain-containing protein [Bacillus cereus]|uniref:helix-turn-helix domain-containing protein n=1 Tax=Bacillus cereus TaxID=1396 RepID=UPI001594FB28|nr:helix-turn-helix domain-containing protein [Bacillus cereus]MDZ4588732.1 helix-turn-helix domain-containing protein [Bacillus cereus]MDZ4599728.1 helix-turn-helix domain-containing protein [Bacillus cereus]WPA86269.1 helix-turn-helix domain-containing protein [Bacillus cereus]